MDYTVTEEDGANHFASKCTVVGLNSTESTVQPSVAGVRQLNVHLQLRVRATRETHVRLSLRPLEGRSDDRVVLLVFVDQVLELLNVRPSP